MAGRHSRTRRTARKRSCRKQRHPFLSFCAGCLCLAGICFGAYLWLESVQDILPQLEAEQVSAGEFRPQVGEPPYRVVVDAGHGGADPGAQGVLVEKDVTAETASVLLQWLTADPNYIPLGTKMYIVSNDGQYVYGYCVAEDTGSAIKGYKVDLYFNTIAECYAFGVRTCTLYILN